MTITKPEKELHLPGGKIIQVGKSYQLGGLGAPCKLYKVHVIAVVESHIVYKFYGKCKQWWHYRIDYPEAFEGHLEVANYFRGIRE